MIAQINTRVDSSLEAPPVKIQAHIARGLPSFSIVGLPSTSVKESKDRVRSALLSANYKFPEGKITVNLTPANIPKSGGRYDLGIALSILLASGQVTPTKDINLYEFYGELGLDGKIENVSSLFPSIVAASRKARISIIPNHSDINLSLIESKYILTAKHLLDVTGFISGISQLSHLEFQSIPSVKSNKDYNEIKGQYLAKRALEIVASGGHNVLLCGTPGAGKTMLCERITTITPDLTIEEIIEVATMHSLAGIEYPLHSRQRIFRSPHHSSSNVAIIGGGSTPKPGEVSLAHNGILFLDELPEFNKNVLETLRQPLESGIVHISRIKEQLSLPARFILIAAMNPCKCGYFGDTSGKCHCTLEQVKNYQNKISGPLLDRIDIKIAIEPVKKKELLNDHTKIEDSNTIKQRVVKAHHRQLKRQGKVNAHLTTNEIKKYVTLNSDQKELISSAIDKFNLSARSYTKVLKVARTIADLSASEHIENNHLVEAIGFLRG